MKKCLLLVGILVGILVTFLVSGCGAVIQSGAALMAKNASDHPASKKFVVSMGKNDSFNVAMRAMTAKDRKIASSDREAGIVQGEFDGSMVTIRVAGKGSRESVVELTVAYAQTYVYGDPKLEDKASLLKSEIEKETGKGKSDVVGSSIEHAPAADGAGRIQPQNMTMAQAQARLNALGFPVGRPDGVKGAKTKAELIRFQKSRGIDATGELDGVTVVALGK